MSSLGQRCLQLVEGYDNDVNVDEVAVYLRSDNDNSHSCNGIG